jgi:hypothetical protein
MGSKMASCSSIGAGPMHEHDYQAEDDHRTMGRAAEIQADPKRMAGVRKHHKKVKRAVGIMSRTIHGGKR